MGGRGLGLGNLTEAYVCGHSLLQFEVTLDTNLELLDKFANDVTAIRQSPYSSLDIIFNVYIRISSLMLTCSKPTPPPQTTVPFLAALMDMKTSTNMPFVSIKGAWERRELPHLGPPQPQKFE